MSQAEEVRKLILEQRFLAREMERLYQETLLLERTIREVRSATQTLSEIKSGKIMKGESLFPVGGGVFVFGTVSSDNKVLVNVGAGVYVTKTVDEALKLLNDQLNSLNKAHSDRVRTLNELKRRHDEIVAKLMEYQVSASGK